MCNFEKCTATLTKLLLPFRTVRRPQRSDFRVHRTVRRPHQRVFYPFVRYADPNEAFLGLMLRAINPLTMI